MHRKTIVRVLSSVLAVVLIFSAAEILGASPIKASAASWNGTNYGGGQVQGYRTFLDAFGIDYDTYMNWLDLHDDDDYYLKTPYRGYDHRNAYGDCQGAYGMYDTPGVAGMNCTGFVWHVLYKSAKLSGASQSQIDSLPVMGAVVPTWASLGVYRIYFDTKEEALASGALEKGDLLWIYGTTDNHNAIYYGDYPSHDRFFHCAGRTEISKIRAPGQFLGVWVAKVTMPDKIELHANLGKKNTAAGDDDRFGTKYCVFSDKSAAQAAAKGTKNDPAWDKRIGTIVTDSTGYGCFRSEGAPKNSELRVGGVPQKNLSYFKSGARRVSAKPTYYAVEWTPPVGSQRDTEVYEFKDSGKRTSKGYRQFQIKITKKVERPRLKTLTSAPEGVKISWDAVPGADFYRVYYKTKNGNWKKFAQTAGTSCVDEIVSPNATYTYTIRCVDSDGEFTSDYDKNGWKHTYTGVDTPGFTNIESSADGVELNWDAVPGAFTYRLYYKNRYGDWKKLGETGDTSFTDEDVTAGSTYTYTIRCLNRKGRLISDYVREGWRYTYTGLDTPRIDSAECSREGVRLGWQPVEGAKLYRVFYKTDSGWKRLGDTSKTSLLDIAVTPGRTYTYTVRCVNNIGKYNSLYDKTGYTVEFKY